MNYFFPYSHRVTCSRGILTDASIVIPVLKGIGALTGWVIRKWWSRQNDNKKRQYREKAENNKKTLFSGMALTACLCSAVILHNVERDPITGQLILCLYNDSTIAEISKRNWLYLMTITGRDLRNHDGNKYNRVQLITRQLLEANSQFTAIRDIRWSLYTEDNDEPNAFALPFGLVYISSSLMDMTNDDQLGIIIGHEISHIMLRHTNRQWSQDMLLDIFQIVANVVAWTLLPAFSAFTLFMLGGATMKLLCFQMPLSRRMEKEADEIGFMMAARACVDITQGPKLWTSWADANERSFPHSRTFWWLHTHPTHRSRAEHLNQLMNEARKLQKLANCHATFLNTIDSKYCRLHTGRFFDDVKMKFP
jgi:Zn-dependent protease with chaperone function